MAIRPDDLTPTIAPPDPNPKKPRITLPPTACDSHFHVFGPHSKFPYAPNRPFTPADAPKEDLFRLHEFLGFQRGVFVQSTCHGSDNCGAASICLKPARAAIAASALLDPSMPDAEVERLDEAGVRGVRLHFYFAHLGPREAARGHAAGSSKSRAVRLAHRNALSAATTLSSFTSSSPRSRRRW